MRPAFTTLVGRTAREAEVKGLSDRRRPEGLKVKAEQPATVSGEAQIFRGYQWVDGTPEVARSAFLLA
jgi:hypothetical protein